ncbi:ABC transporter ATP-binding protein [Vibrio fluvialis]|uniref:ABC transporter ATP-binding protein n=1 Tax=Vibrio fluvialis TaxID=676 RepID=UPI00192B1782|nr:ABC transporter ATP-binding protein [Vibrio fluvialis]MBL4280036.1 ABC transporter ATP-binding protein [Vibrio fluvialis]
MGKIKVVNLRKVYKQYPKRTSRLVEWLSLGRKRCHNTIEILKGISFDVASGDSVAILGVNGAGKSTLLKIITGTTSPTEGHVELSGKVSALLELGMGFHPEFTGRQNVYMSGQLLGMSTDEISAHMASIIEFSEIGEYIDKPVRVYSSGMQVRLAFAVATSQRPDILIVDEALSVGDSAFQRKCFQRIESYREEGMTLLFVTHDIETVKRICNRAILIKSGTIAAIGDAKEVSNQYEREQSQAQASASDASSPLCETVYGNGKAEISLLSVNDQPNRATYVIDTDSDLVFRFHVSMKTRIESIVFSMMIKTKDGVSLYGINSIDDDIRFDLSRQEHVLTVTVKNTFAPGMYCLNCGIREDTGSEDYLQRRMDCALINIIPGEFSYVKHGVINTPYQIEVSDKNE